MSSRRLGGIFMFQQDIIIYEGPWICSQVWHSLPMIFFTHKIYACRLYISDNLSSLVFSPDHPICSVLLVFISLVLCVSRSTKYNSSHIPFYITRWQVVAEGRTFIQAGRKYTMSVGVFSLVVSRAVYYGPLSRRPVKR